MNEVVELRVHLALSGRQSRSAAQGSPAVEVKSTTNFGRANLGAFRMEDPTRRLAGNELTGSHLALTSPAHSQSSGSSRRSGDGEVALIQGDRAAQVKQIKGVPTFDGTKVKFPAWKRNFLCLAKLHGHFEIFVEGVDVPVADEECLSQRYSGPSLVRTSKSTSLHGTSSLERLKGAPIGTL